MGQLTYKVKNFGLLLLFWVFDYLFQRCQKEYDINKIEAEEYKVKGLNQLFVIWFLFSVYFQIYELFLMTVVSSRNISDNIKRIYGIFLIQ